jgi:AcrR family transcriptional regulator
MPERSAASPSTIASPAASSGGRTRPLRADALRNRARVLEAAHAAFAADGLAVPLDEIARRAGVGAGTVYRHFATKEALFEAVIADHLEALAAAGRAALDGLDVSAAGAGDQSAADGEAGSEPRRADGGVQDDETGPVRDPGEAFFGFLRLVVANAGAKMDLADALIGAGVDLRQASYTAADELRAVLAELLARAQAAGAVRADVYDADLHAIAAAAVTAERRVAPDGDPGRLTRIICDGLRPLAAGSSG